MTPTSSSALPPGPFCVVDLPDSWQTTFTHGQLILPDGDKLFAFATTADGGRAFGVIKSADWTGVAAVSRAGSITQIRQFDHPDVDGVIAGAFDGRWLVWAESHSQTDLNDWDVRAWDDVTMQVIDVASAPRVNGATVPGPFVMPVVSDGRAAWVQANPSGQGEVHLFTLSTQQDRVLSAGKAGPPVAFWGSNVIWQEIDVPGQSGHLAVADATSGDLVDVPSVLASLSHLGSIATAGSLVAWDDFRSLWVWRTGQANASKIFEAPSGDYIEFVAIAGDLITWGGVKNQWAADLRSGSVTKITEFGWRYTNENTLLVTQPIGSPTDKNNTDSQTDIVHAPELPALPGCSS